MNNPPMPTRQQSHLAAMLALEQTIGQRVEYLNRASDTPELVALLNEVQELTTNHQRALAGRLQVIAPEVPIPPAPSMTSALEGLLDGVKYPASTALITLHTLLDQAILGYSVLLELCLRAADSWVRDSSNTADPVLVNLREYSATAQKIVQMLHYTVVKELEQEAQECQCTCPACSLGICLCAIASKRLLGLAWVDAGPIYQPAAIVMVKPRVGSAAARAGLHKGDLVSMVDGKDVESIPMLQDAIGNHQPGEEVHFRIKPESGEESTITLVRP